LFSDTVAWGIELPPVSPDFVNLSRLQAVNASTVGFCCSRCRDRLEAMEVRTVSGYRLDQHIWTHHIDTQATGHFYCGSTHKAFDGSVDHGCVDAKADRLVRHDAAGSSKPADRWSSSDKFQMVLEVAALNEVELSAYCRRKGIYPEQIAQWRQACELANGTMADPAGLSPAAVRAQGQRLKQVERDLAEARALLVL
jgi:transposase-like protein